MARILIIDDDVMLLDLLQLHLSGRGISVEVAESAAVALRSIIESPPDLIMLDLGLPDLDGMEVLQAIKGDETTRHLPVIVITGTDTEARHLQAKALGADAFLTKPVERDALINEIFSRLARSVASKPASTPPEQPR